jgi:hypothetical protein
MQPFLKLATARMPEDTSVRSLMSRWLALTLAGMCLAATPAHGGVKRTGTPTISLPASRPPLSPRSDNRAQRDPRPLPESLRKLLEGPPPAPREREGVCAAGSICETF